MEKHPLHGVIHSDIKRPPADIIKAFRRHDTAKIADAMARAGVMSHEIKPIQPGMKVCGPAVTVWTKPGDVLYVLKASDVIQTGDVLVIDEGGSKDLAAMGERYGSYLKSIGTAGIVIDGATRDSRGLIDLGLPTFARAVCIAITGSIGPGAINVPIQCGGAPVNPGDLIVGDDDGVVVVPREHAAQVLKLADEHLAGELARLEMVRGGKRFTEVANLEPKLAAWRTP
ncbi:MAG: RraA family protein [Armatimonadetes bacterium]|nr:RraA family protein [Armatimonadota bacterium]